MLTILCIFSKPFNSPNARVCIFCRILTTDKQYFPKSRSLTETSVKYKLALCV